MKNLQELWQINRFVHLDKSLILKGILVINSLMFWNKWLESNMHKLENCCIHHFFQASCTNSFCSLFHLNNLVLVINFSTYLIIYYFGGKDFRNQTKVLLQEFKKKFAHSEKFCDRNHYWTIVIQCLKSMYHKLYSLLT